MEDAAAAEEEAGQPEPDTDEVHTTAEVQEVVHEIPPTDEAAEQPSAVVEEETPEGKDEMVEQTEGEAPAEEEQVEGAVAAEGNAEEAVDQEQTQGEQVDEATHAEQEQDQQVEAPAAEADKTDEAPAAEAGKTDEAPDAEAVGETPAAEQTAEGEEKEAPPVELQEGQGHGDSIPVEGEKAAEPLTADEKAAPAAEEKPADEAQPPIDAAQLEEPTTEERQSVVVEDSAAAVGEATVVPPSTEEAPTTRMPAEEPLKEQEPELRGEEKEGPAPAAAEEEVTPEPAPPSEAPKQEEVPVEKKEDASVLAASSGKKGRAKLMVDLQSEREREGSKAAEESAYDEALRQNRMEALNIPTVVEACLAEGTLFEDPNFTDSDSSLYIDPSDIPAYATVGGGGVTSWKRPEQITRGAVLFSEDRPASDVKAGDLPDRAFLGAASVVATMPGLATNLFGHTDNWRDVGLMSCRFFHEGDWREVVIDTKLPFCDELEARRPAFGHCERKEEMWLPLLEKAYAKLYGSYEAITKRQLGDIFVDLTGGSTEIFDLRNESIRELVDNGELWRALLTWFESGCVLSGVADGEFDDLDDADRTDGILPGHPYGVLDVIEMEGFQLLRIRNPWGDVEWRGAFSDHDQMWAKHPDLKEKLNYQFGPDGTWWMRLSDWADSFSRLYVCRLFPKKYHQTVQTSTWHQLTAAGPPRIGQTAVEGLDLGQTMASSLHGLTLGATMGGAASPHSHAPTERSRSVFREAVAAVEAGQTETMTEGGISAGDALGATARSTALVTAAPVATEAVIGDPDPRWFNNPQFRLTVQSSRATTIFVSLMQSEENPPIPINCLVMKAKTACRLWECNPSDILGTAVPLDEPIKENKREVNHEIVLSPEKGQHGIYHIVCYQDEAKPDVNVRRVFHLRLFSSEPIYLEPKPQPWLKTFKSEWGQQSAGGRRLKKRGGEAIQWCTNPQFVLNFQRATTLKIVCERALGKRRRDVHNVGFVVTRLFASTDLNRRNKPAATQVVTSSAKLNKLSRSTVTLEERPPELGTLHRKLQILSTDWWQETSFSQEDVACMHLSVTPQQGPLVVVPSLAESGALGSFTLNIFADRPLKDAVQLDESKNVVLYGGWTAETAGGCHLFHPPYETQPKLQTWQKNPKYTLHVTASITAHVTLARLDKAWRKTVAQDPVGAMMGFYILRGDHIEMTNVISETPYLPGNEVAMELQLEPTDDDEPYIIMPTTYEPNKVGEFIVRVSANKPKFELHKLIEDHS
ncbi:unnamed protein product [Vitrella brassicaformis CCMP3155]|uniref:Calpain catalytic domain-containing protein n=1 Tax=Vitrella brassicaformis (strain CCMP3155) TaxID=1169540 RepID=A0A0G4H1H1_VITBC|nr:unnamed protein product [Vitrella brassicaformis CCMP3155]|eukprot:CEM37447.1 unnamed protein product [Vitrella brassicaformis CCMP3155]